MQKNSKYKLYGDPSETVNHISNCSKLSLKNYMTSYDFKGKVIHRDLCKRLKCDYTRKFYKKTILPRKSNA